MTSTDNFLPQASETPSPPPSPLSKIGWTSTPGFKFILLGVITILLLLPTLLVWGVVEERSSRATQVARDISRGWGGEQLINGPYIAVPYTTNVKQGEKTISMSRVALLSAEMVDFKADMDVEERKRSIYSTTLYHSKLAISGRFAPLTPEAISSIDGEPDLTAAYLVVGVSDNSGFRSDVKAKIGGTSRTFEPGLRRVNGGNSMINGRNIALRNIGGGVNLTLSEPQVRNGFAFEIDMALNGSRAFHMAPAGQTSSFEVESDWPHPGFDGRFLPEERDVNEQGFTAKWTVPYLARGVDAVWNSPSLPNASSAVTINFVKQAKFYQMVTRTLKYSIAFFALIFLSVFILEQLGHRSVHWIQYILVGLAMVVFYVLLLALAEHVGFSVAYGLAAVATTVLIAWYVGSSLGGEKSPYIVGTVVAIAYALIYLVLREEEYALLAGALVAFIAIAGTMIATRKLDWSGKTQTVA